MGLGFSKQFIPLCGVPVIVRTLLAFEAANTVQSVVIVCRSQDMEQIKKYVETYKIKKAAALVYGGDSRQASVAAGVAAAGREADCFAIHDGARPLVMAKHIDACVRDCFKTGASALGVPVKDTYKILDDKNQVVSTPNRSKTWLIQTPQVFESSMYKKALAQAEKDGANYTDDCQLMERIGVKVHICMGGYSNIKLTTPEDVCIAEAILKNRGD